MNYRLFTDSALAAAQTLYYGWSYKVTLAAILGSIVTQTCYSFLRIQRSCVFGLFN